MLGFLVSRDILGCLLTYLSVRYCEIYARAIQGRFLLGHA